MSISMLRAGCREAVTTNDTKQRRKTFMPTLLPEDLGDVPSG